MKIEKIKYYLNSNVRMLLIFDINYFFRFIFEVWLFFGFGCMSKY